MLINRMRFPFAVPANCDALKGMTGNPFGAGDPGTTFSAGLTHSRTRVSQEPDWPPRGMIPRDGADSTDAQAAWLFPMFGVETSPSFQTIKVMAAIHLQSRERRLSP